MDSIKIIQDKDKAIEILRHVSQWMEDKELAWSDWWRADKLNREFFEPYAKPEDFYVVLVDSKPAATAILQAEQNMQDWSAVDGNSYPKALYIHYLAVEREFAGKGLLILLINFAVSLAKEKGLPVLRLDTNADEPKLCNLYEEFGFRSVKILNQGHERIVLYEKIL